jgi:hypothetical protein
MKNRLARLEQLARPHRGYEEHWRRVWAERLDRLDQFMRAVPRTHRTRVAAALGADFELELCHVGFHYPAFPAPALKRWAWEVVEWGPDHPFNKPAPPTPFPVAFLDLMLAHPGEEASHYHRCPGCRQMIPSTRNPYPRGPWLRPRPLAPDCPWCGKPLPAGLVHRWTNPAGHPADWPDPVVTETTHQILDRLARAEREALATWTPAKK